VARADPWEHLRHCALDRSMRALVFAFALLTLASCVKQRGLGSFHVLPRTPNYLLRSPDSTDTPFPEILRDYNGFEPGQNWMDLRPKMELSIENAYYQDGMPKRGLKGFLGTEVARYLVQPRGLRLLSVQPMKNRPADQVPVQQLIRPPQTRHSYYRFYFEILFKRASETRGSVLLGANSKDQLDRLASRLLTDPDSVCGGQSKRCTIFPEACSVSVEMEVVVNGASRSIRWGSRLAAVAEHPQKLELWRLYNGRLTPVELDLKDANALRLPLLPGDRINWR